jgi:hypothetical protein
MFTLVLLFRATNTRVLNSGLLVVSASIAEKGARPERFETEM